MNELEIILSLGGVNILLIKMLFKKNVYIVLSDYVKGGLTTGKICLSIGAAVLVIWFFGFLVGRQNSQLIIKNEITQRTFDINNTENYFKMNELIDYKKIPKVLLNEREQVIFDFLATQYCSYYNLPEYLPYLFASIESDFSVLAFNKSSGATGIFQITNICLQEYNDYHTQKIQKSELFDIFKSFEVSMWYINRLIHHYKIPFSVTTPGELYIAYNIGPASFKKGNTWDSKTEKRYIQQVKAINVAYIQRLDGK